MSVTVRTVNDGDDNWPATHWRVEEAHLWVCSVDRLLAEYPPGQWTAVWREDDEPSAGPYSGDVDRGTAVQEAATHWPFPPGVYRLTLLGQQFEITSADYREAAGTATLHARVIR